MDQNTFDQRSAQEWINSIEKSATSQRDHDIYPMISTWLHDADARRVADIGCGQGICAAKVELNGAHYTGIDPSPYLIDRARELYSGAAREFIVGNAYNLPIDRGACDAAFSVLVWHLLSDIERAAAEMARVLERDGAFLIITAHPQSLPQWAALYDAPLVDGMRLEGVMTSSAEVGSRDILYFHPLDKLENKLAAAGLQVTAIDAFRPAKDGSGIEMLVCLRGRKT